MVQDSAGGPRNRTAAGGEPSQEPFLTERRVLGLLGAAVIATAGYWLVTRIGGLEVILFFLVFAAVFAALNYALYRHDRA